MQVLKQMKVQIDFLKDAQMKSITVRFLVFLNLADLPAIGKDYLQKFVRFLLNQL